MTTYRISDAARRTGLPISTLRYYPTTGRRARVDSTAEPDVYANLYLAS